MKTLPATYRKNGYQFTVLKREGNVVMAEQRIPGNDKLIAYEVFVVHVSDTWDHTDRAEGVPSNEKWGIHGKTAISLPDAEQIFQDFLAIEKAGHGKNTENAILY